MPTSRPSSPTTPPKPTAVPANRPQYNTTQRRPSPSYLASLTRWLQLKKYQYEVTFSLYMLTPTERLIFNFIILTLLLLLITAATMYLPNHVTLIYNRIWYYVHGNSSDVVEMLKPAVRVVQESVSPGFKEGVSRTAAAGRVLRTAVGEL